MGPVGAGRRPRSGSERLRAARAPEQRCRAIDIPLGGREPFSRSRHSGSAARPRTAGRAPRHPATPGRLGMFGKLSWAAIPLDQPIPMVASAVVALTICGVLAWVVFVGHLPYLWREWITSVDHKR